MFKNKMVYGIRHELHNTKQGDRWRCVPFKMKADGDLTNVLFGDFKLDGAMLAKNEKQANKLAGEWNKLFRHVGIYYDEFKEKYSIDIPAANDDYKLFPRKEYKIASIYMTKKVSTEDEKNKIQK